MTFPKLDVLPVFICEVCTVRAQLQRELHGRHDSRLLQLERVRILDVVHYWAPGTHSAYQTKLRVLRRFDGDYGTTILTPPTIDHPPQSQLIPLMWAQEEYSLRRVRHRRGGDSEPRTVSWNAVRQLRSALSYHDGWRLVTCQPDSVFSDQSRRLHLGLGRVTDGHLATLHATGMSSRLGTTVTPSTALLDRHVRAMDADLWARYQRATTPELRRELALAGLAHLTLWLGWLRSSEAFGLRWCDCRVISPASGLAHDLPRGVGAGLLRLQPETKSSRTHSADVVVAFATLSGYRWGDWFHAAREATGRGHDWLDDPRLLFTDALGTPWDSRYFRETYLYPALLAQRAAGDPHLVALCATPADVPRKFWSLHCYRRGARTTASRRNRGGARAATASQIYEHGRWRMRRSAQPIDKLYDEWTLQDRVKLTLLCA